MTHGNEDKIVHSTGDGSTITCKGAGEGHWFNHRNGHTVRVSDCYCVPTACPDGCGLDVPALSGFISAAICPICGFQLKDTDKIKKVVFNEKVGGIDCHADCADLQKALRKGVDRP